jgi:hypothetical protein
MAGLDWGFPLTRETIEKVSEELCAMYGGHVAEPEEAAAPRYEWWVLEGGFFAQGGKTICGPFETENDVYAARRWMETQPKGWSYYIDKIDLSSKKDVTAAASTTEGNKQ